MGVWQEVSTAKAENRHEIKLSGAAISKRIEEEGLDKTIFQLNALNLLNISDTCLSIIPNEIKNLVNLQTLLLYGNKIQEFNENITLLSKLKVLDLSRNQLSQIPDSLNRLKELSNINFSSNQIETLPKFQDFPNLLSVDISNNKLASFIDLEGAILPHLSDLKMNGNAIDSIPAHIAKSLPALKNFDIGDNQVKVVPGELANLAKLKEVNLKGNKLADRRLMKLVDQCRTKQIVDYVNQHCPKSETQAQGANKKGKKAGKKAEETPVEEDAVADLCHCLTILHVQDETLVVKIDENNIAGVRPYILCCIVQDLKFTVESFRKFIQLQTRLHDTVCEKRNLATVATHDLNKISGPLLYTAKPPGKLVLLPLMRTKPCSGEHLFEQLRAEADALRKEKKRNTYSGIHKYLYLLEGKPKYPCLVDASGKVISFPPITNSEDTKMTHETRSMLVEVTSQASVGACKSVLDRVLHEFLLLGVGETDDQYHRLNVQQVKIVDLEGNLRSVYPSRTDCQFEGDTVKVLRINKK